MKPVTQLLLSILVLCPTLRSLASESLLAPSFRIDVISDASGLRETLAVRQGNSWLPALSAESPVNVMTHQGQLVSCRIKNATAVSRGLVLTGQCPAVGDFEQRISLTRESDTLDVTTRLFVQRGVQIRSVEDRYSFVPKTHSKVDELTGPLDFVWSQNIKSESDDLIPLNGFKSPVVMMQQGPVFVALLPLLNQRHVEQRALDLDVTSERQPWMSYGAIPSTPHGHSYFRRADAESVTPESSTVEIRSLGGNVEYRYSIALSAQPQKMGYVRVVRLLWQRMGHASLLASTDAQQNVLRPELRSFASWREEAWHTYADRVYTSFPCGDRTCGTLSSNRNYKGEWTKPPEPDAWFNAWFQTLRTAYGWYGYGKANHDEVIMHKAETILNLALSAPQNEGAFPTIYLVSQARWVPSDGWAGYSDSYHAFSMSWTAYWMLRWAEDMTPGRKAEILRFVAAYGDFLLKHQQPDGVIPSWYDASTLTPRSEFRDFNAETAPSALLLVELGKVSGEKRFVEGAARAMSFITRQVVPRQRWFDFETYLSCARKGFNFFDPWTAQYPQNNLAEIQAPQAMLGLYNATHEKKYLEDGTSMLDYLLLTQQVSSNPLFTPVLFGGFTTQNTDAEWSDARQAYVATVLFDYYNATGRMEYLERAVAAARSSLAVAPWENWAHTGYMDDPGALTGFHWGTGSGMTSVELLSPGLGDALIDLHAKQGVGFDETSITNVLSEGRNLAFDITSPDESRTFLVRFRGVDSSQHYRVRWNAGSPVEISGAKLQQVGLTVGPLQP